MLEHLNFHANRNEYNTEWSMLLYANVMLVCFPEFLRLLRDTKDEANWGCITPQSTAWDVVPGSPQWTSLSRKIQTLGFARNPIHVCEMEFPYYKVQELERREQNDIGLNVCILFLRPAWKKNKTFYKGKNFRAFISGLNSLWAYCCLKGVSWAL